MLGKSAILSHKKTQDGVRAWIEIVSKYENGGDCETRINTLEAVIGTPFHGRYKGAYYSGSLTMKMPLQSWQSLVAPTGMMRRANAEFLRTSVKRMAWISLSSRNSLKTWIMKES